MKIIRIISILALLCASAWAQGLRFGDGQPVTTTISQAAFPALGAVPNAQISFCNAPANAVPCTNKATTYTDQALGTPCSSSTQIVLAGTTSCVATADSVGNWGVWSAAGQYAYTITVNGVSAGPFYVSLQAVIPTNGGDNTKKFAVDTSTATAGTTSTIKFSSTANRTATFPDATDTVVEAGTTQTLTGKTYDTAGAGNVFKINGTAISTVQGNTSKAQLASGTTTTNDFLSFDANGNAQDSSKIAPAGTVVGTSDAQTLTNKSLNNSSVTFVDNSDATKQVKVSTSGSSTATAATLTFATTVNRVVTFPDAAITVSGAVFEDCGSTTGATQNCAATVKPTWFNVRGDVTLNGAATQAIGTLPFTSSSTYSCTCGDLTAAAGICNFTTYSSGASATIQESGGANTDHLRYQCSGY